MRLSSGMKCPTLLLNNDWKIKEARDNDKVCAAVLTDILKAFDCPLHDLLIAKLRAFGFDLKFLRVIHAYLNDRIQVIKVGSFYSEILQIIYDVPQGSLLGPLLFNINLIDLFLEEYCKLDYSNYAHDTTPYNCRRAHFWKLYQTWFNYFYYNSFKANNSKLHLFLSPFNAKSINIKSSLIEGSHMEKFLGITIDSNFTFKKRINGLCKNEDLKLHALNRCVRKKKRKKTSNI